MKLKDNLINYTLPTSKPSTAKLLSYGTLYDNNNKFWELEGGKEASKLVNAIEIDWNNADLANATAKWPGSRETIETTGQLLAAIKAAYNHVEIGTTATTAAAGNHTHNLALATDSGTPSVTLSPATTYKLTAGGKTLIFKTPADNTGSAADGNTWRPVYVGSTSVLTNNISSGNLKFDGGEQINPVWDSTNKVIKFNHYKTDGRSYGPNQVPGLYKFASDAWGHIIAGAAVTKSDITALGIPAQDTVYTHPTYTAKSSGLYKITVDANGHVTGTAAVTASDLKSIIKDLLVAGDNINITENSAGKLVVSCTGVQAETIALKVIGTLKENGAEVTMSATTASVQSVLATDTNTYVNSNWTINNETNFSINATSNVSAVTVTANVSAAKGTVGGSIGSASQTTSYGKRPLTASFTQVSTTKSTKVTATHNGSSSYVTLKYTKTGQSAGAYTWSGTLPSGLTLSATTGTSIEVRNSTSSEITVSANVVQVTNANGSAAYKFGSFTVPGKQDSTSYYYYAGWTQPTTSNVDTIIAETYPAESGSTTNHTAGKKTTSKSTMDYTSNTLYNANAKATYYVLVPTGHAIYDSLNNNVIASTFTSKGNITVGGQTHTVYASNSTSRNIGAIIIK